MKQRESDWTLIVRELSVEDRLLTLFHYVRDSGVVNMAMEQALANMYALCYGVYIGLLGVVDFDTDAMWDMPALYQRYMFRLTPDERRRYEQYAGMLPFGIEYGMMHYEFEEFSGIELTKLDAKQAVKMALFVMRWVGKESLRQRKRRNATGAQRHREQALKWVPLFSGTGEDRDDIMYGITEFELFIRDKNNRRALVEAVDRETGYIINPRRVEELQMQASCVYCQLGLVTRCCWPRDAPSQQYCSSLCYTRSVQEAKSL